MTVDCSVQVEEVDVDYDADPAYGRAIEAIGATCRRCGHYNRSFGSSAASMRRCLVLMRHECPRFEENFYVGVERNPEVIG